MTVSWRWFLHFPLSMTSHRGRQYLTVFTQPPDFPNQNTPATNCVSSSTSVNVHRSPKRAFLVDQKPPVRPGVPCACLWSPGTTAPGLGSALYLLGGPKGRNSCWDQNFRPGTECLLEGIVLSKESAGDTFYFSGKGDEQAALSTAYSVLRESLMRAQHLYP